VPEVRDPAMKDSGVRIAVKGFRVEGNAHISEAKLFADVLTLREAPGKSLSLSELNAVAADVTRYYRQNGYLVAVAYIRPQEVAGGLVTISVLEGQLDRVRTEERAGYSAQTLRSFVEEALCGQSAPDCHGTPLETRRVERAVGLVADLPAVADASGTLSPGREVGSSDYALNVTPGPAVSWRLGLDNYGNRYIGRERLSGYMRLDNLSGRGERIVANLYTTTRGMDGGTLDASLPMGYDGWRGGVELSSFDYRLLAPFDVVDAHGRANVLTGYATYPLLRSSADNIYLRGAYSAKQLSDSILGSVSDKRAGVFSLGVSGSGIDTFLGGGFTAGALSFFQGQMDYRFPLAAGARDGSGNYGKATYSLSRDHTLAYPGATSRLSLYAAVQGQKAGRNLDSSESFSLGGPDGVRAYPQGEALGDSGHVATLELRYSFAIPLFGGSDATVGLFRDIGRATINENPVPGYAGPAKRSLSGSGIALSLVKRDRFGVKLTWASRDSGSDPATAEPDSRSRFWLQAIFNF
jgi:hemolysin activation/secretion protein